MANEKRLGSIAGIKLGEGGYDDAAFGFSFDLRIGNSSAVGDFWGMWRRHHEGCEWTPDDRIRKYGEIMQRMSELMAAAKVSDFNLLVGKPIELTMDGMRMVSWRILTEVL